MKAEDEPGLAPSADSHQQRVKKVRAGRGLVIFIAGVAIGALLLYLTIAIYAGVSAS